MSELTTPIRIDIPGVGSIESADLYLKSEADKVIADLKQKIKQQDVLLGKALNAISESHKHVVSLAGKCNHANYKRCLAMAEQCHILMTYGPEETSDFYDKWTYIWQELAEEFKPSRAKETK